MTPRIALVLRSAAFVVRSPLQVIEVSATASMWGCEILWARTRATARAGARTGTRPDWRAREAAVLLRMLEVAAAIWAMITPEILLLITLLMTTKVLLVLVILRSVRSRVGILTIRWRGVVHSEIISNVSDLDQAPTYPRLLWNCCCGPFQPPLPP